jgi:hypothetical protein
MSAQNPPEELGVVITAQYIRRFQTRARIHYWVSAAILLFITSLAGAGMYIFWFAQDIDRSKGSVELLSEVQIAERNQALITKAAEAELEGVTRESEVGSRTVWDLLTALTGLGDAKTRLAILQEKERLMKEVGYFSDIDSVKSREELQVEAKELEDLQKQLELALIHIRDRFRGGEITQTDVEQGQRFIGQAKFRYEIVQQKLKVASAAKDIKSEATNAETLDLIRTSLIRFGGVAVILFLISVLVPTYKYNVRLATYYLARADTLLLFQNSKVRDFTAIISLLTLTYDFDKEPPTPIDSVASLLKTAADVVKKT